MKKYIKPVVRIVDDDDDLREALKFILEAEGWKVEAYASAFDFLRSDASSVPGCLLLDVKMEEMNGLELQQEMKIRGHKLPIVFLSAHGDIDMAVHTLHEGAVDFLQKPIQEERLIRAIARAVRIDTLKRGNDLDPEQLRDKLNLLTQRELEVAQLLGEGLLNREIAERFGNSVRTIETHRLRIFNKLGIKEISELVQFLQLLPML